MNLPALDPIPPALRRQFERELTAECIALGLLFLLLYPFAKLAEVLS